MYLRTLGFLSGFALSSLAVHYGLVVPIVAGYDAHDAVLRKAEAAVHDRFGIVEAKLAAVEGRQRQPSVAPVTTATSDRDDRRVEQQR